MRTQPANPQPASRPQRTTAAIKIILGSDAGSLCDLKRIQEICNSLHVSDILAKLAA